MERSFEVALARLLRFQPREIAENLLLLAWIQRFPILHRSRISLQRRLKPQRHGMLWAVPVPRIETDLHPNAIADLRAGRPAHVAVQIQIKTPVPDREHIDPPRHRRLAVDAHEHGKRLAPAGFDGL